VNSSVLANYKHGETCGLISNITQEPPSLLWSYPSPSGPRWWLPLYTQAEVGVVYSPGTGQREEGEGRRMRKKTLGYGALTPTEQREFKADLKKYNIEYIESETDGELVLLNLKVTATGVIPEVVVAIRRFVDLIDLGN
jgi:hypothetical protein